MAGRGRGYRGRGARRRVAPAGGAAADARGGVLVLVVAFVPVLAAVLSLVLETGRLFVVARWVQAAADLGALAGAQEVDLERLADGERWLDEARARAEALSVTGANLRDLGARAMGTRVQVYVVNVTGGRAVHPRTGRSIRDPTVSVWVEAEVPVRMAWWVRTVRVSAHADASVVERRSARR